MEVSQLMWEEGWRPTTDLEMQEMIDMVQEKTNEIERIEALAQARIKKIEDEVAEQRGKVQRLTDKVNDHMLYYVKEEVTAKNRKETDTQTKYKMLGGEIVITKSKEQIEKPKDDSQLLVKFPDFVKVPKPTFEWGEFKKQLILTEEGKVLYQGNLPMPIEVDVSVMPTPVKVKFAPKKEKGDK